MTELSKEIFYKSTQLLNCNVLVHPNSNSCFKTLVLHFIDGVWGTGQFYSLIYLLQLLIKGRRLTKPDIKDMMKCWLSEALGGGVYCAITLFSMCAFKKLFGKFNYYCIGAMPGLLGGISSIFVQVPKKRGIQISSFMCLTFESIIQELEKRKYFTRTKLSDTVLFILSSTTLLYLLRIAKKQNTYFWIFTPPRYNNTKEKQSSICPHDGPCDKEIMMSGLKYFSFGVTVQWLRSVIPRIHLLFRRHLSVLLLQKNHVKMGIFLGLYVSLYKAVSCLLCQELGYDSPLHAIPAGAVAGLTYLYRPEFGVTLIAIVNLLLVLEQHLKTEKKIPQWPYSEIIFSLCGGYLFHTRMTKPSTINKFVPSVMSSFTNGRSEEVYSRLIDFVQIEQNKCLRTG